MTKGIRKERDVEYACRPANSPDLNEIEPLWENIKGTIAPPDPGLFGAVAMSVCQAGVSYILKNIDQNCGPAMLAFQSIAHQMLTKGIILTMAIGAVCLQHDHRLRAPATIALSL